MLKKINLFVLVCALLLPSLAHADMMPDNSHTPFDVVQVDNVTDFPEYNFYINDSWEGVALKNNDPVSLDGKYTVTGLFAVKKSDEKKIIHDDLSKCDGSGCHDGWIENKKNSPYFFPFGTEIKLDYAVSDADTTKSRFVKVHIDKIEQLVKNGVAGQDYPIGGENPIVVFSHIVSFQTSTDNKNLALSPANSEVLVPTADTQIQSAQIAQNSLEAYKTAVPALSIAIAALGVVCVLLAFIAWKK